VGDCESAQQALQLVLQLLLLSGVKIRCTNFYGAPCKQPSNLHRHSSICIGTTKTVVAASLELASLQISNACLHGCFVLVSLRMHTRGLLVQISPGDELLNPLDSVSPDPLFSPTTSTTTISNDTAAAAAVDDSNSDSPVRDAPLTTSPPVQSSAAAAAASSSDSSAIATQQQQQQQSPLPWDAVNSAAPAAVGTA
jgi:hypothetical protein